jgi:hypothetical protein
MARISRFRSAVGTDYSDDFEHCRSMKHYFQPRADFDWSSLEICSPVQGKILALKTETDGTEIQIQSQDYPDFEFRIAHVMPLAHLAVGASLQSGEKIGHHFANGLLSDISVGAHTTKGWKLISYFDVIADSLFISFGLCGVHTNLDFIINKEARDAAPLTCEATTLKDNGQLENWTVMDCRYDVDAWGYPHFVTANYIDLDRIWRISKFRSAFGHDYSDDFEHCRSMKHYFQPKGDTGWETVRIYAPVNGTVSWRFEEWLGTQLWIRSQEYPDFEFGIFHIQLQDSSLAEGQTVRAGQLLGTHFSTRTMSDIAVLVHSPKGRKLISYFEVMADALFQQYQIRGLAQRSDAAISKTERDAHPLTCQGEAFVAGSGALEDWFYLK